MIVVTDPPEPQIGTSERVTLAEEGTEAPLITIEESDATEDWLLDGCGA